MMHMTDDISSTQRAADQAADAQGAIRSTQRAADQVADAAQGAIRSTQRVADQALDRLSDKVDEVRSQAAPLLNKVSSQAEAAARRGMEAVRETSQQLRERALQAQDMTLAYAEEVRFPQTYPELAGFLRDSESYAPQLSPKRFGELLGLDVQTLAQQARVHRNTVARAPGSKAVQDLIREALRVIKAATDLNGNLGEALHWYRNEPLAPFGYRTAERLVADNRADDVVRYVSSLEAGAAG
jgi:hypothetical protein